ncbi:unnamed protein product [Diatraea saccharalis]|uniref:EGF-like domain-containing protein n=1 Tax=Diatraea saccharalis TaxID=40085 RepID=A0A9P0CB64_9NEOP|nr:unnamed protein product [Diatraea saccharalis]
MWNCVWCLVLVSLPAWVYAGIAEELAEATQLCCSQGTRYARNHTSEDCSSSVPPDVSPAYGALCIFAMDQCCKEYFQKKDNCEDGAEIANKGSCDSTSGFTKTCCTECSRGKAAGSKLGDSACTSNPRGTSPEELLAGDTYESCCKKAAEEPPDDHNEEPVTTSKKSLLSVLPSLCEDYAPNELCAHHCIPIPGSYKCECNPGFKLMADRRNCIEVVKNRCKPHNPCQHKCNDNGLQIKCSCRRGYELLLDGKSCKDIDECILDPPVCLPGTQCHNIQGSYRCILTKKNNPEVGQCPPGFTKNIMNNACDDINECKLPRPPCPSYLCENTVGGYKCGGVPGDPVNLASSMKPPTEDRCPSGFRVGYNEECEDVDECAMNKDDCNHLSQFCINTRGEFYCQDKVSKHCPPGFKIDPITNKCEDINECEDGDEICRPDQICINQLGQYDCKLKSSFRKDRICPDGMRLTPGTSVCEDIDECVEGTHLCDQYQNCLNTNGSHECTCKIGFEQDITTGACVDVNECATDQHSCILETQRCDNTIGSFLCIRFTSCGTGYILQHSTGKCEDIDECALGTHNCARAGPEYHCVNIPGSFRCIRKRSTTTSTTPLPEYEYYYDSEEEIDGNETSPQTGNQPEYTSSTTTTPKLETSSETPRTVPATKPTEPPHPTNEFPTISKTPDKNEDKRIHEVDERTNEVVPPSTDIPETSIINFKSEQPQPVVPPEIEEAPTTPKMEFKQQPTEPKLTPISPKPDKPDYYEPRSTESNYLESPSINESTPPDTNELMQPETTYSLISSTLPTVLNQPSLVYVEVGKETATVKAHKEDDGSLVINTKDVPKNEWTKVNEKPTNCQFGFELDEYGACYDIDECVTNRHKCSGLTEICKNTMGGYLCECAPGFRRDLYTGACDLVVSSTSTTTSTTVPPPTTTPRHYFWGYPEFRPQTVRPFRPRNLCDAGFHLDSRTGQCEDVNECINGQANCAEVEICVNTEGGYRCECPPNWHIDNFKQRCVPNRTNEQFPTGYGNQPEYPSIHGSIIPNFPQGEIKGTDYVDPEITPIENRGTIIRCPWGYRLGDDSTCVDIDECSTGDANCGPLQICMNLPGGYTCSCPSGHRLIGDHECEDVDECMLAGRNPICSQNADCINTIGSYQCRCHEGFRSAPINDKVCVDVDECTENRAGSLCEQRCNNVWGSYRCSCHRGYRINADNSTCADIDECTEFKSKFLCVGKCYNQPGSYRCDCPSGYRLSEDKRSCIDIDECETGIAPCAGAWTGSGSSDVCLNTRGGYRCHRINCPPGYQLESKHRCTKVERVCPPADWECAHQPSTYSYNFITFVSNLFIPDSKVDLFTMRGPTWAHAQIKFQLRLLDVNAPPTVKNKADINSFLLSQSGNQGVVSLVRSLEGPQSIELELMMELYNRGQFGGIAVAKLFIFISEYEF